jgi:hypothetical protein
MGLALAALPALLPAQGRRVAAPTGVAVTSDAAALTVSWNNMTNAVSYVVNRRSPEQALATVASSPYSGTLPQPGVSYEYQVVSVGQGKNNTAASPWVGYTVPNSTSSGTVVTEPRPPRGPVTPIPAGPSSLSAASAIPGQIQLRWNEVANATGYRVMRSSNAPEPEAKLIELPSGSQSHTDAPVDLRFTYTYKVLALFGGGVSTPSPVATAQSMPVVHPTGLKYAVALTPTPGRVNVTLSWNGVPNATLYSIFGPAAEVSGTATINTPGTSYTLPNVPAGRTYRACVGAIYPFSIGDPDTAPCIDVKLTG